MTWTIRLVRGKIVNETRFFYRYILRRRKRWVEEVIFATPAPTNTRLVRRLHGPTELYVEAPLLDPLYRIEAVRLDH